jgi:3-oxoadipate enol-lactonase
MMARLHLQGRSLAYDTTGSGTPVVLIHGLGSSQADWGHQVERLRTRFLVVTMDLRGHGRSSLAREPFEIHDLAEDVRAVINHLALGECHVVGLSLGGMVAFQLAVDAPELVRSLTIVNSGPEVVARTAAQRWALGSRKFMVKWLSFGTLGKTIGRRLFPHERQAAERALFVEQFVKNDRESYRAALDAIVGWSVLGRIGDIRVPTLIVTGDRDYTPVEIKHRYAARMPNATVTVIEDSGHATPVDQPDAFNAVLVAFLDGLEVEPPGEPGFLTAGAGLPSQVP